MSTLSTLLTRRAAILPALPLPQTSAITDDEGESSTYVWNNETHTYAQTTDW
jgi:hypothetical protein